MRRDEVLEHRQALHEVGLDRPLDDFTLRVGHQATHARQLADLLERATGTRVGHHEDGVQGVEVRDHRLGHLVGRRVPLLDDRLVALLLGDQAVVVLAGDVTDELVVLVEDRLLLRRHDDIVLGDRDARLRRVLEAQVLERVEDQRDRRRTVGLDEHVDQPRRVALLHRLVDERVLGRVELVAERLGQRPLDAVVVDDPPDRREDVTALAAAGAELGHIVQLDHVALVGQLGLLGRAEHVRARVVGRTIDLRQLVRFRAVGQVVGAEDHVLGRRRQRRPVSGAEDVVRRQHQDACLGLRLGRQRQVHRHLVAVEVGVEGVADQRVHLDRLALDEQRLERLDAEAVKRRRAVEQHGVLVDDLLEHVPNLADHRVDHLLGRLDVLRRLALDQAGHDERLEQLERHDLRQAALVELQVRAGHDDRAPRVVHALAQEVLAEAPLLALEHVGQALQRPVARTRHGTSAATVVEQRVDGLLEHPLLVVDDDLGRTEVEQPLEPVVAVDHPAVQVVEVRGGESPAVQLDHRTQLRRDDRHGVEDHHLRFVARLDEGRDDLQPLDGTRLLLAFAGLDLILELDPFGLEVDLLEEVTDRFRAHAAAEVLAEAVGGAEALLQLAEGRLVVLDLLGLHRLEELPDVAHPLGRILDVGFGVGDVGLEGLGQLLVLLVALLLGQFRQVDVERVRPQVVFVVEVRLFARLEVLFAALQRLAQLEHTLLALSRVGVENLVDLLLERVQVLRAGLVIDPRHDRSGEVENLLEFLRRHVEQVADAAGHALEEPDVADRRGQVDVAHALAADLRARDLHAAALAHDALVADALVLAAVALPVLRRPEDPLAEQAILLRLQRAVVDRLRLGHLARAPGSDLLGRREGDLNRIKIVDVNHLVPFWLWV